MTDDREYDAICRTLALPNPDLRRQMLDALYHATDAEQWRWVRAIQRARDGGHMPFDMAWYLISFTANMSAARCEDTDEECLRLHRLIDALDAEFLPTLDEETGEPIDGIDITPEMRAEWVRRVEEVEARIRRRCDVIEFALLRQWGEGAIARSIELDDEEWIEHDDIGHSLFFGEPRWMEEGREEEVPIWVDPNPG